MGENQMTCKNCKHWKPFDPKAGICSHPKLTFIYKDHEEGPDDLYALDKFYTGPDFGCVHFTRKEDAK